MLSAKLKIDKSWTLFLDRDGVINVCLPDDYVKVWDEFVFTEDVFPALKKLSQIFGRIIIVTNQQGVGKKLMTEDDLKLIHQKMLDKIIANGGRVDAIYTATSLVTEDKHGLRKPLTGMGVKAKKDFPEIDFKRSVMVGDTISDMQFGKSLGMTTVLITHAGKKINIPEELVDYSITSLREFM